MKPTFQMDRPSFRGDSARSFGRDLRKSSVTACHYQTPATQLRGSCASFKPSAGLSSFAPNFRALSDGFFAAEAKREWLLESGLFALIGALAAWPIVLAVEAAAAFIK